MKKTFGPITLRGLAAADCNVHAVNGGPPTSAKRSADTFDGNQTATKRPQRPASPALTPLLMLGLPGRRSLSDHTAPAPPPDFFSTGSIFAAATAEIDRLDQAPPPPENPFAAGAPSLANPRPANAAAMPDDDDDDLQGDPFDEAQLAALETIQDEDVFFQENQVFFQDDDVFSWNNQPSEAERTGDASNLVPVFQPADVAPSGIDTAYGYAISLLDPALGATAHLPMDLTGLTLESGNGKYIYCSETEKPASFVYEWILQASETGLEVGDMEFSDVDIEYRAQRINLHKKCQNQGINVPAIERVEVVESDDRLVFRVKVTALHDEVQFTYSQNISEKMAMFSAVAETMQALHSSNIYHGDADLSNFFVQRCPQSQGPGRFKAYAVDLDDVGEQIGPSPVWRPDDRSDSKRDDVRKLADEFSNTIRRHLEANKSDVADARQRNLLTSAKKFFDRVADAQRYPNCTIEELCTYLKRFDALYHATGSESH